jgi:hypothetical protein
MKPLALRSFFCRWAALILLTSISARAQAPQFHSSFLRAELAPDQPNFVSFSVDSIGKGRLKQNVMLPLPPVDKSYELSVAGNTFEYRLKPGIASAWSFRFDDRSLIIRSVYTEGAKPKPVVLNFDPKASHTTLLGLFTDEGEIRLPALLHFPDQGTFRITTDAIGIRLGYDTSENNFIRVTFPPADAGRRSIEYRLEVTAIYPPSAEVDRDPRYDGYRRDFLNILQLNPRRRVLTNNAASDACAFTLFEYSMMASHMPPLADGLSALDIIRQTLDRYVGGMLGYGMVGYDEDLSLIKYDFLDTYPSLVLTAAEYVRASHDVAWAQRNYSVLTTWTNKMIEFDSDGDGLMEYPLSGNSGSWPVLLTQRPSNWWDTIGFGHKDAYSNALAYRAFIDMAELSRQTGHPSDAKLFEERARKIKAIYYKTFYNPKTGVLAGWKSADGQLHDYYFLFVNGIAVTNGLVTQEQGNAIWDKLLAKMKEVGYTRFELGLPGNLIPVRREDYITSAKEFGGPEKEDGSDGFQIYENGGATASFAYYTIEALKELGRKNDADAILFPMLKGFDEGGFQGSDAKGKTYDWKAWDGTAHGYEGLLVDGYLTLLAAMPSK